MSFALLVSRCVIRFQRLLLGLVSSLVVKTVTTLKLSAIHEHQQ